VSDGPYNDDMTSQNVAAVRCDEVFRHFEWKSDAEANNLQHPRKTLRFLRLYAWYKIVHLIVWNYSIQRTDRATGTEQYSVSL